MKLLLIGIDGMRLDVALPGADTLHEGFAVPNHPADPRFAAGPRPDDAPAMPPIDPSAPPAAPTLARLLRGGAILPVWMTPPTDSGPGWASLLTGTTHEQNNVWWNEFVGHQLDRTPDILSRIWFADPAARTYAASTWDALIGPPGPVIHQRLDQQRTGRHQVFCASDFSRGCASADQEVTSRAAWTLNHEGPDAGVVYLEGVDEAGHAHGAASLEYRGAITRADEHVRHLVKAVSERHEQLGEDWLIAVVTDHGHTPEGGHGDDETDVRRSFLLLHRVGADGAEAWAREAVAGRGALRAEGVTPLLLELIGIREGRWDADHAVGERIDVPPVGPTREARHEW